MTQRQHRGQRSTTHLRAEQLEPRYLMSGDGLEPTLDFSIDAETIAQSVAEAAAVDYEAATTAPLDESVTSVDELRDWLINQIDARYGHLFGQQQNHYPFLCVDIDWPVLAFDSAGQTNNLRVAASDFSTTNVQVEGVDEADLVETDGDYVYFISDQQLVVVDVRDADSPSVAARVALNQRTVGMYLSGDRLTLISSTPASPHHALSSTRLLTGNIVYRPHETQPPSTTVTVIDLHDRSAPSFVGSTQFDGQLVSSRMVDGQLRLVFDSRWSFHLPTPRQFAVDSGAGEPLDTGLFASLSGGYQYESRAEYLDRVLEPTMRGMLGEYRSLGIDGEVASRHTLSDRFDSTLLEDGWHSRRTRTTIATFDVHANTVQPLDTHSFTSAASSTTYATEDHLYLFSQNPRHNWRDSVTTAVRRFEVGSDGQIEISAKGQVDGTLLNEFSVDEHDGFLRVVTTHFSDRITDQMVTVLEPVDGELQTVGTIDSLAPGEALFSVRFAGERAYAVTFLQTDPFFAIDLSNPTDPQVLGELVIPGFSDYLQPIDENTILAIGRGADSRGRAEELQVSIFDVNDMTDPQLAHRYSFDGGRSIATIATGNRWARGDGDHHAVSYFGESQILAMPIHSEGHSWWSNGNQNTPLAPGESALQVFHIDVVTGIEPLAFIAHDSAILRSLQVGDHLVAVSNGQLTLHDLDDPTNQVGSVVWTSDANGQQQLTPYKAAQGIIVKVDSPAIKLHEPSGIKQLANVVPQPATPIANDVLTDLVTEQRAAEQISKLDLAGGANNSRANSFDLALAAWSPFEDYAVAVTTTS